MGRAVPPVFSWKRVSVCPVLWSGTRSSFFSVPPSPPWRLSLSVSLGSSACLFYRRLCPRVGVGSREPANPAAPRLLSIHRHFLFKPGGTSPLFCSTAPGYPLTSSTVYSPPPRPLPRTTFSRPAFNLKKPSKYCNWKCAALSAIAISATLVVLLAYFVGKYTPAPASLGAPSAQTAVTETAVGPQSPRGEPRGPGALGRRARPPLQPRLSGAPARPLLLHVLQAGGAPARPDARPVGPRVWRKPGVRPRRSGLASEAVVCDMTVTGGSR